MPEIATQALARPFASHACFVGASVGSSIMTIMRRNGPVGASTVWRPGRTRTVDVGSRRPPSHRPEVPTDLPRS